MKLPKQVKCISAEKLGSTHRRTGTVSATSSNHFSHQQFQQRGTGDGGSIVRSPAGGGCGGGS